jgi:helix-hairpin-helix protein
MALPPEHKALLFVGAVAVLGAGVRVVRAATRDSAPAVQPALEHQVQSADSSARAEKQNRGRGRSVHQRASIGGARKSDSRTPGPPRTPPASMAPLERTGYVGSRLDLDVATAAQIDSLPGVSPSIAKRILADRRARGPFLSMNGLRRVSGIGPAFVARIDSLVTFSGTVVQPTPTDTLIPRAKRARGTARPSRP